MLIIARKKLSSTHLQKQLDTDGAADHAEGYCSQGMGAEDAPCQGLGFMIN